MGGCLCCLVFLLVREGDTWTLWTCIVSELNSLCREELDFTWPVCTVIINKQQVTIMLTHRMGNLWLFLMWRAVSKINMIYKYLLGSLILIFPRCPEDNTWNIYFRLYTKWSGWFPIYSQYSVVSCYHGLIIFDVNLSSPY